jgi:dihydroorotate dehydrogenase
LTRSDDAGGAARASPFWSAATAALRTLDPETAHRLALAGLKAGLGVGLGVGLGARLGGGLGPKASKPDDPIIAARVAGLNLPNVLGLAAGFDKDAEATDALLSAGFGFVECGTVTPRPQAGNSRPRLFRLTADRAVINRMGFNNKGLELFAARLAARRTVGVVGANLGANKDSEDRIADYVAGLRRLRGLCDYFTVNVSSPNTPGLRDLQARDALDALLGRLAEARSGGEPVFLKVAPDLEDHAVEDIVAAVRRHGLDGVIVANTTVSRPPDLISAAKTETGGLSGAPLFSLSTALLRRFYKTDPDLVLIGAGGVASGADAYAKIRAGAHAVQLYSALTYAGPGLVRSIKADLAALLSRDGFVAVDAARGVD